MTHYAETHPRARVEHRCLMCGRTIMPGETYRRAAGLDRTSAWTWKECAHCAAFVRVAWRRAWQNDGYDSDLLAEFQPRSVAEAAAYVRWGRKWRRIDGSLYPVPRVIEQEDSHGVRHPVGLEAS